MKIADRLWKISKRKRHVRRARHAGQIAFDLGVALEPVFAVVALLRERFGFVGNCAALDYAQPCRDGADRAERQDRRGRHRPAGPGSFGHGGTRDVRLKVVVGFVEYLPDAVQIGMAVACTRRSIGCCLARRRRHPPEDDRGADRQASHEHTSDGSPQGSEHPAHVGR